MPAMSYLSPKETAIELRDRYPVRVLHHQPMHPGASVYADQCTMDEHGDFNREITKHGESR